MSKYLIEFIGTFFLVVTIGLTGGNALAIGGVLAAMVYMGGYISGGHYNPAVTLGVFMQKGLKINEVLVYMLVQLLAALAAAGAYAVIHGSKLVVAPGSGVSLKAALLVEIIFTFALVSVVLHTAVSKTTRGNSYYGLAIGFVLMAGVFAGGKISGGAFNPAVGLAPNLLSANMQYIWLYLIGPFAGAILASLAYKVTQAD